MHGCPIPIPYQKGVIAHDTKSIHFYVYSPETNQAWNKDRYAGAIWPRLGSQELREARLTARNLEAVMRPVRCLNHSRD